jgi:hypothetical protein
MIVAVGAVIGGQTGMAAVIGRRKQLVKSQQLQPVAATASIATADNTNSFFMIDFLRKTDRGEYGGSEWLGRSDRANSPASEHTSIIRATEPFAGSGGGLSNSTPPFSLCKRNVRFF